MNSEINHIEQEFIRRQKDICKKYGAEFFGVAFDESAGVALESFDRFQMPIDGLRHSIENDRSVSWYIWSGEYSDAHDFFKPIHVRHLLDVCPKAINYLGLAPGWRFFFDSNYEDVWYDESLLDI